MAFEGLTGKLQSVISRITGRGKLTESDVREAMREVRLALLEADVNYLVVKDFINRVTARAIGADVLESLTPGQQVVKIVYEEMTELMGAKNVKIAVASTPPTVIMLAGLQGVGKTAAAAKLALYLRKQGKTPLLAACDVHRPAAIRQLQVLGQNIAVPVFEKGQQKVETTAAEAVSEAKRKGFDTVIIDTAGRLHIDTEMMDELKAVKARAKPHEVLYVVDAMAGQDAVNSAKAFLENIGFDGIVLTKLDGDARGGAALSVKAVTGKPVKFAAVGEKPGDFEPFHPERMASRILGMGDVLTLVEKAQDAIDVKTAQELEKKLRKQQFTLEDFLGQFKQIRSMGSLGDVLGMLPGGMKPGAQDVDEKEMTRMEAIIFSMTTQERRDPSILNGSRRRRIASGSGTSVQEVNRLLNRFESVQKMMKQLSGPTGKRGRGAFPF
ncbi:MAG: signal recognition particle protein [Bacillota bacterium]|nr:signal recognition particle protein [Bacillota bacterium]